MTGNLCTRYGRLQMLQLAKARKKERCALTLPLCCTVHDMTLQIVTNKEYDDRHE